MEKVTRIRFMFQTRSLTTGFLVASLGIAAGLAVLSSPKLASADAACDKLTVPAVQTVCKTGGVAAVKKSMKTAMDEANTKDKAGLKCDSCHANQTDYKTKGDDAKKGFEGKLAKYFK
jgi:hypothetical protein